MGLVDLVFPKRCVGCGREGEYICEVCQRGLRKPEPICPICTNPSKDGWSHFRCRKQGEIERLSVGLPYRGLVQKCLKKVKYQSQWDRLRYLFELWKKKMDLSFREDNSELLNDMIVTSVPMWRGKEMERGFNQAEILAELIAKHYGVRYLVMLERVRETKPMFGLDKKERKDNVEKAFRLTPTIKLDNIERVMLVDDVWTTGNTLRECGRELKRGGVKEVWGVTLAR